MRTFLFVGAYLVLFFSYAHAQSGKRSLQKLWETDSTLKLPESVVYDEANNVLYVSNIDGDPGNKDGKGSIGKIDPSGKIINVDWVYGLNAPLGLSLHKGTLWVADIDRMVLIDTKTGTISSTIPVPGALFLNDVSVDKDGICYVTDMRGRKIYKIENNTPTVLVDSHSLKSPNGILWHKGELYVADAGSLYEVKKDNKLEKIAGGMHGSTDGIENVKGDDFIVSCWWGVVYYVPEHSEKEILLDTSSEGIRSADIGYDAKKKILYIPTFYRNTVAAYQLK